MQVAQNVPKLNLLKIQSEENLNSLTPTKDPEKVIAKEKEKIDKIQSRISVNKYMSQKKNDVQAFLTQKWHDLARKDNIAESDEKSSHADLDDFSSF